jgi:hypothetical protein
MRREFSRTRRNEINDLIGGLSLLALLIVFVGPSRFLSFWGMVTAIFYIVWAISVFNVKVILDDNSMIINNGGIKNRIYYNIIIRLYCYKDRVTILNDKKIRYRQGFRKLQ